MEQQIYSHKYSNDNSCSEHQLNQVGLSISTFLFFLYILVWELLSSLTYGGMRITIHDRWDACSHKCCNEYLQDAEPHISDAKILYTIGMDNEFDENETEPIKDHEKNKYI